MKIWMWMIMMVLVLGLAGCGYMVGEDDAVQAAKSSGMSAVTVLSAHQLSPHWFGGCSGSDDAAFKMVGTNSAGEKVNFTVCCGAVAKGCTVRF